MKPRLPFLLKEGFLQLNQMKPLLIKFSVNLMTLEGMERGTINIKKGVRG